MLFDESKGRQKRMTKDFRTRRKMKTNGKMITLNPDIVLITLHLRESFIADFMEQV